MVEIVRPNGTGHDDICFDFCGTCIGPADAEVENISRFVVLRYDSKQQLQRCA